MAKGGRRPGAGRKPGAATKKTREIADKAIEEGLTPLEYMLNILRDEQQETNLRFEAAKAAASYVHPKLAAIEHSGPEGAPLTVEIVRFGSGSASQ